MVVAGYKWQVGQVGQSLLSVALFELSMHKATGLQLKQATCNLPPKRGRPREPNFQTSGSHFPGSTLKVQVQSTKEQGWAFQRCRLKGPGHTPSSLWVLQWETDFDKNSTS